MYVIEQTEKTFTLSEYKNRVYFSIHFEIGKIKVKTEETEINPLIGKVTVAPWKYNKKLNDLIYNYKWI